jgi:hypothetical protein
MISNSKIGLWISGVASLMISSAPAQTPPAVPDEARAEAINSLQVLRDYGRVNQEKNLASGGRVGVPISEEIAPGASAQETFLGDPLVDYVIGLTDLQNWNGANPDTILHSTGRVVFPIDSKEGARSSVTVAKTGDQWSSVNFGSYSEAQSRGKVLKDQAPGGNAAKAIQVRVPTLHLTFVAYRKDGALEFTPISNVPKLGLAAGVTEPAKEVLLRIQPAARKLDPNGLN